MNSQKISLFLIGLPILLLSIVTITNKDLRAQIGEKLIYLGLFLEKPFHTSSEWIIKDLMITNKPNVYGNSDHRSIENFKRSGSLVLSFSGSKLATLLAFAGGFFEYFGDYFYQKPYLSLLGSKAPLQKPREEIRFLTLNACMFFGGLPLINGGITPASDRIESLSALIKGLDIDFLLMQEVSFEPGLVLAKELEKEFSHFFVRIGPNPWKLESCLFAASKHPIVSEPKFIPFPYHSLMKRGVFCIETPDFWILNTHLEEGDNEKAKQLREMEVSLIVDTMNDLKESSKKPCFLFGDLNVPKIGNGRDEYERLNLNRDFVDPYNIKYPILSELSATCTNLIQYYAYGENPKQATFEIIDYALLDKEFEEDFALSVDQVKETLNLVSPGSSLSDHRGILLKAAFKKR